MTKTSQKTDETLSKVYSLITLYVDEKGYPPTVRELMEQLDVSSTSTVKYYLDKLEEKDLIKRSNNKNRAIEINRPKVQVDFKMKNVPLIGEVAAGNPILAFENYEEMYQFSDNIFNTSGDIFMLTVKGDSMVNAGIYDKDRIVVRKQNTALNSEIVVAMINGSATVKRFFKEDDTIRLQPENDYMQPIYAKNVTILGKVVGLVRNI